MSLKIQKFSQKIDVKCEVLHYSNMMSSLEFFEFVTEYNKLLSKYTKQRVVNTYIDKRYDYNGIQVMESISIEQTTESGYDTIITINLGEYVVFTKSIEDDEICTIYTEKEFKTLKLIKVKEMDNNNKLPKKRK